jgi:predicted methyltransferase
VLTTLLLLQAGYRYITYCGKERSSWLTTQWVLTQFSDQVDESIRRFETFVADGLGEEYRKEFHQGTCRQTQGDQGGFFCRWQTVFKR